jgi:hypothetical protein
VPGLFYFSFKAEHIFSPHSESETT